MATPETAKKGCRKSSSDCCATVTDGRWRLRLGNTPSTMAAQRLRQRFRRVVLVGGMLTDAREDLKPSGLD